MMAKSIIHVNSKTIQSNAKNGTRVPPITVRRGRNKRLGYGHRVQVLLPDGSIAVEFVYSPERPLSCGARLWAETDLEVRLIEEV